jgi:hypothetical protein
MEFQPPDRSELDDMFAKILEDISNESETEQVIPIHTVMVLMAMPAIARKGNIIMIMMMDFYNTFGSEAAHKLISHMHDQVENAENEEE